MFYFDNLVTSDMYAPFIIGSLFKRNVTLVMFGSLIVHCASVFFQLDFIPPLHDMNQYIKLHKPWGTCPHAGIFYKHPDMFVEFLE